MDSNQNAPDHRQNPPITVVSYQIREDAIVHVVRDDLLPGGTKQRALDEFIAANNEHEEFVYAGPTSGFAQIAITLACRRMGKQAVLFLVNASNHRPYLSIWCRKNGAKVTIMQKKLTYVEKEAQLYTTNKDKSFLIPFGLDCPVYAELLYKQLRAAVPPELAPKRLWTTIGSGTILQTLARIWPDAELLPVQVGKKAWEDQYSPDVWKRMGGYERIKLLAAPQPFFAPVPTELMPPYPSVATYDAKVWQQVLLYAEDGDYIWNVATDAIAFNGNLS